MDIPERLLLDAILKRRTCKEFTDKAVEFDTVAQIIQAGSHAPSAGNLQNWKFIVITDNKLLRQLYHHTMEQDVFNTAPIGVIVCSDMELSQRYYGLRGKRLYSVQDCAACIQNMLLAAEAFELGACWVGAFDEEKVASMFSIPDEVRAQAIILFGHPAQEPEEKKVKRIEDLIYFNKYKERIEKPHLMMRDYSKEWKLRAEEFKEKANKQAQKIDTQEIKEKVSENSKKFYTQAQERLNKALESLKDEEKSNKNKK